MPGPIVDDLVPRVVRWKDLQGREDSVGLGRVEHHGLGNPRHLAGPDSRQPGGIRLDSLGP